MRRSSRATSPSSLIFPPQNEIDLVLPTIVTPNGVGSRQSPQRRVTDSKAMCTVVVSLDPGNPVPLLLLGIRDEFTGRPWRPPARHWPGSPLIGGRDEEAGGTWL